MEAQNQLSFILLWLLIVCKVGGLFILLLRQIRCRWCGVIFCVCWHCWRGQAYCCDQCRLAGKRKAHREAQRRYRQTLRGKKSHREAENRRRHRLIKKNEKKLDDATSTLLSKVYKMSSLSAQTTFWALGKTGRCHFCGSWGVIVDRFPRRGYGKRNYRAQMT